MWKVKVIVTVVVMMVSSGGKSQAAGGKSSTPPVSRTPSIPLTASENRQTTLERTLASILTTLEENHNDVKSSMREVMRAVRRTQREVQEVQEDMDLILSNMYKASCQQVAEELHENSRLRETLVGVYTIKPPKCQPTQVRCELSRGAVGWTIILSRYNGQERFNRTYREYQEGFGDPNAEYYIGNEFLYHLTNWRPHVLRVVMEDFSGQKTWVQYNLFKVAGPEDSYRLTVGEFDADSDAGDGLQIHDGMKFSTYDRDDDTNTDGNCAQLFGGDGGWWYSNCYHVLPTGKYRIAKGNEYGGVAWYPWRNVRESLKAMTLLVMPR